MWSCPPYRIVQEALSNTLRHAPGCTTRVEIEYVLGGIGLRVVDGPPTQAVILVRLGLRDRTQAAVFAYETRLVTPGG